MSNSMDSPKETDLFENMELLQGGSDNAAYRQLGHAEEQGDDLEEFEILERPLPRFWQSRRCRWMGLICLAIVFLGVAAVLLHWLAPLFLDKVIIPLMIWESTEFSKPVLAVVLVCSLAIFPMFILPSGPSMWLSGMMFGYGLGFLIIMSGTMIGQTLPYFIGQWLLHDRIQMWLTKYPKKAAVLRVAEQGGWFQQVRTIMLLRVSPFPYPLFNYVITVTNIKYGPYIVGSICGMVPEAFITIYSGRLLFTLAEIKHKNRHITPLEIAYNIVGACIAAATAITATIYGRRALKELELKEAAEREASGQLSQPMTDILSQSPPSFKHPITWTGNSSSDASQPLAQSLEDFPPSMSELPTHSKK
ncbi:uncharacterized protein [Physcomitrium patens]|nr:Golgi apparatus membrane protein TVP38-like isoform X2 [Physcomitrium patens]XP_024396957.1 Golgi apparatus membrane protein TVP38-like isoform X2 [Physcomitrium patens]XP_024396958.1 Golgi apparatus membrane protein TVP38-like isoform X2 [Physcomitrium patens]|eukprot:XP_024396956.1 Golgi apparatus membrane protein TVP38-like isoform X2 [Physcomitrella patens]